MPEVAEARIGVYQAYRFGAQHCPHEVKVEISEAWVVEYHPYTLGDTHKQTSLVQCHPIVL
jgi:hypothetical protein